ncbi:unnamed protein product, partial [Closterium sp. NIES-65]
MSAFADGTAGQRARGGGKRNGGRAAAAKGGPSGRQSQDADGGDEGDHAEPEARGGGKRTGGRAAATKGGPSDSQDADGGDEKDHAEPEATGGGIRNGGRAAAAKGGPTGRQSKDADGGDEGDHAKQEARGGGMRNGGRAAAAKAGPSGSQDADGGDDKDHAEPEARGGSMRNGGRAAAAKGGPSGRQTQDADGGDEKDHAVPACRGVNDHDEDEPAAVTDGKGGREAVIPYQRRKAVDLGSCDHKARQARRGPNVHVLSSSGSEEDSSDSESGSSSGSEEVYEDEVEEEEDEDDEELEPESEDGEEARPLQRRSVRKLKKGNAKQKSERGRVKISADPYAALRDPRGSAGKGDQMAWGSARFGKETTDPPPNHMGGRAVHVKNKGATKWHEPSVAAAANDGLGGVWANALGECGGSVEGSMWDIRESRGEGGDEKMDPATKEGRGESMGTPGASSRPDVAGGRTVEQLMRELAQRDREIAALKARPRSKGAVKPCTPPSRPPPLASLSSGPSIGGLDPDLAPKSPATVDVAVRRTRGMPTPKLLKLSILHWPLSPIPSHPKPEPLFMVLVLVWVARGARIAHCVSNPSYPSTLSPIPRLALLEPLFLVLVVVWVSCGGGIAKHSKLLFMVLVVGWVSCGGVIVKRSSYPSHPSPLSPIPPLPLREPMFMVLGVVWVSCGGGIAKHSKLLFMVLVVGWVSCGGVILSIAVILHLTPLSLPSLPALCESPCS